MRSDSDIKRDVEDELRWDPDLDATDIAVTVKSGVVALAGFTRSYADKLEAEAAAKRVAGVLGVANDIEVRLPALDQRPDPEIARDAIAAIKSRLLVVAEHTRSANPYRLLYTALGIGEPEEPRTKPSCCDAEGQPPIDPELVEQFERGLRDLGRVLPASVRTPTRRRR